ncbi:MAG: FAD-dependent oxidoreductase [Pseudonocardiaceae bacterium]
MIGTRRRSWSTSGPGTGDSVGTAVLGAGPAGLTAAHMLALRRRPGVIYEADGAVGGLAKTLRRGPYRFDLGGQVFGTSLAPVQRLWDSVLGDELISRPRSAKVYCRGRYLAYPPNARDLVAPLWVSGSQAQALRAVQELERYTAQKSRFDKVNLRHGRGTTLCESCQYPRLGPGQMWDALRDRVVRSGISVRLNHRCVGLLHSNGRIDRVVLRSHGNHLESRVDGVLSSLPLSVLVSCLQPRPPTEVLEAATALRHRSIRVVALMTDEPEPFPDNWIYVHDAEARVTRVQNFGAWSKAMVERDSTCLGVEFACTCGGEIWKMDDVDAVELAKHELARIGLIDPARVFDAASVSVERAYPIADARYREDTMLIRDYLKGFQNLETFGRNGLHRDNTQDHSVWSAMLATGNLLDGSTHDLWDLDGGAVEIEPDTQDQSLPGNAPIAAEAAARWAG